MHPDWPPMAGTPPLHDEEVHLWLAHLGPPARRPDAVNGWLSPEEKARAARYRRDSDRNRFIQARGILRELLSRYTNTEPQLVQFAATQNGKPFLAAESPRPPGVELEFNVAHSEDFAVYGFARGRSLGVDIEAVREVPDAREIESAHFAPKERAWCAGHDAQRRTEAFFTCWARKEAVVKAIGKGLALPLPSFDTTIPEGKPGALAEFLSGTEASGGWWVVDLPAPAGYASAAAVERGSGLPLRLFAYSAPQLSTF